MGEKDFDINRLRLDFIIEEIEIGDIISQFGITRRIDYGIVEEGLCLGNFSVFQCEAATNIIQAGKTTA